MAPEPSLSSNWKKLQATLKQESKVNLKKVPKTERQQNSIAKRKRLEESGRVTKRSKMGISSSTLSPVEVESAPSTSLETWAEDNDISAKDIAEAYGVGTAAIVMQGASPDKINAGMSEGVEIGQYVAIDCEMVGVGGEEDRSVLARVSIVNFHGVQVYDSFVRPKEFVTDWRTHVSGVSPKNMATARPFEDVQEEVAQLLKNKILIGHAIKNDLDAMMLGHPKKDIRDTSKFPGFRKYSAGRTPSLKKLAKEVLGIDIQGGEHSSIEDARATMLLFRRNKQAFEVEHSKGFPQRASETTGNSSKPKKKNKSKR